MSFETIIVEKDGGVATITLNRPEALNAITTTMLSELKEAVGDAGEDPDVGVIVLTGAGRAFSAGVDLKALGDVKLAGGAVGPILDDVARELIALIQAVPKAVIAQINGFCMTGALEIALACDLIVAAEEAKLSDTHAKWGLRPTWGMSARLPQMVGLRKAKELSFTADTFTGAEAVAMGLANRAVPLEELEGTVRALAEKILANSQGSIAAYKTLYNEGSKKTMAEGLELEANSVFEIADTEERLGEFRK